MAKGIRVTVEDLETGETATRDVVPGDYILIPLKPCYLDGIQRYPGKGTTVLTLKDNNPQKAGGE
jgi:hypothetical protein